MNDLNMEEERSGKKEQRFALFVDEAMRPRRPDFGDLPNSREPSVKSYDDPRAVYNPDRLYRDNTPYEYVRSGDGIVKPGVFAIASDMYARGSGFTAVLQSNGIVPPYAIISFGIEGHIMEGYHLYLQDNYEPNDDGVSPIEKHDWGLTLGIMRGSGSDAGVKYWLDPDDGEGNNTWEIESGSNVTSHPDTCDAYGNLWDYVPDANLKPDTKKKVEAEYKNMFSSTVVECNNTERGHIASVVMMEIPVTDTDGSLKTYRCIVVSAWRKNEVVTSTNYSSKEFWESVNGKHIGNVQNNPLVVKVGAGYSELDSLNELIDAYVELDTNGGGSTANSIGSLEGRFSLKLRAEKLNPYFDPKQPESDTNRRYLEITDKNLRQRGLIDQFYKEYSYWVRNARIANIEVRMEMAQLLAIDKTKKVRVGDVTGFIRKMQYTISNKTGLGLVTMEIMYI